MIEVKQTPEFASFLRDMRDTMARTKILRRIDRLQNGNPGDVKPVGEGLSEMRIDHGPGYRVYMKQYGEHFILLLCGGDKSTQDKDIRTAKRIAENYTWP